MNIFDAHVSGSLSVSGSSDFSGNLNVSLGTISGSFKGDGSQIVNIPASGVTGLNLTQIADGTATASISQTNGFNVNTDINVSGSILPSVNVGDNVSVHSLGSSTNAWNHLYISTGSIKFVNDLGLEQGRITINPNSGQFNILNTSGLTQNEIDQIELGNVPSASLSDISIKSLDIYDSIVAGGSVTASAFTGSFKGEGQGLYNIPASGVTGLNLNKIISGSVSASISPNRGLEVNTDTTVSGSLVITGSLYLNGVPVGTGKLDETTFNSYTSSNDSTNTTQTNRLNSVESTTASLNSFTSSINTTIKSKLDSDGVVSGSVQINITGTTGYSTFSSSIDTTNVNQNNRINSIETSTGSLNSFTSSINTTIKDKMNSDGVLSGSITFDISTIPGFSGLTETVSGSISSSVNQLSGSLTLTVTNLSSSLTNTDENQNSRIVALETSSGSLNSFTSSINTTIKSKLNTENVISGSVQVNITGTTGYSTFSSSISSSIGELSSSIATTNLSQNNRLDIIEGRYATTGSNVYIGNQIITGSLYISANLVVQGSSSLTDVTASNQYIGTNKINLNTSTPGIRFGGVSVFDSGSNYGESGSLLWDSQNNRWLYQHPYSSGAPYKSAIIISGPQNSGSLGDEQNLTTGKIQKAVGNDHIGDSIISETGGGIGISGSLSITGSIISTGTSLISGSSQIDHDLTTNYVANKHIDHTTVSITAGAGLTGGGDISSTRTINVGAGNGITVNADDIAIDTSSATFTTGVKSKLNNDTVHSGSYLGTATTANLSENTNLYYTDARVKTKLSAEGVISGSAQVTGIGNSQLTNSSITIGSTSTSLGGTSTSLAGLTSVTSTAFTGSIQGYATSETLATVTGRGASTTNKLTVTASGTGGSPLLSLSVSNAASFVHGQETFAPNLTSTQAVINPIGVAGSTKNAGYIGYKYSGTAGSNDNLLTFGHWGADHLMTMNGAGNVSITGTVTASNLSGTNTGDQTNITGNAGTVTNGLYTTGDQTITGQKTFPSEIANRPILSGGFLSAATGDLDVDIWGISEDYYPSHATSANAWGLRWYGTGNEFRFVGGGTNRVVMDMDTGDIVSTGTISGSTIYGTWNGVAIANSYLANSSFYVGTTSISLGRGSASQTLSGVSIDGTAASETLATVTGRGASTSAALTLSSTSLTMSSHYYTLMYSTNETYVHFYPSGGNGSNYSAVNWRFWTTGGSTRVLRAAGDGTFTWDGSVVKTVANSSYSTTFSSVTSVTVTHNLGTKDVAVFVYDSSDNMFWPSSIVTTSTSVVTITFASSRSGRVVVVR